MVNNCENLISTRFFLNLSQSILDFSILLGIFFQPGEAFREIV